MLIHCKSNGIHCKINIICIAVMLTHCRNKGIPCKLNIICIAVMLIHCKNNGIPCKLNMICLALMRIHCKNNGIHDTINIICIALMLIHCTNKGIHCKINIRILSKIDQPRPLRPSSPNGPNMAPGLQMARTTPAQPPHNPPFEPFSGRDIFLAFLGGWDCLFWGPLLLSVLSPVCLLLEEAPGSGS